MKRPVKAACHWTPAGAMLATHVRACVDAGCEGCTPCPEPVHCGARRRCVGHPAPTEVTCPRCVLRGRQDTRMIEMLAALVLPAAVSGGRVWGELANLAGPSPSPYTLAARRTHLTRITGGLTLEGGPDLAMYGGNAVAALAEIVADDPHHPAAVLSRWAMAGRHALDLAPAPGFTVSSAASWLLEHMHTLANNPRANYSKMLTELRDCRAHLEEEIHNSHRPEVGAPCPKCSQAWTLALDEWRRDHAAWLAAPVLERAAEPPPRPTGRPRPLVKHYDEEDVTGASDRWLCDRLGCGYTVDEGRYRLEVGNVARDHADRLTAAQVEEVYRVKQGTLRKWAHDGKVTKLGTDGYGRMLYRVADILAVRDTAAGGTSCRT